MFRSLSILALISLAVGLAAAPADAVISVHGDDLENWLGQKRFELRNETQGIGKKQRKAVDNATRKFAKDSSNLTADAKVLWKTLTPLAKPFAEEGDFENLSDNVLDALEADMKKRRAGFTGLSQRISDKRVVQFLDKKLPGIDRKIGKADAAGISIKKRGRLIWQSFRGLDALDKKVLPAMQAGLGDNRFIYMTGESNHAARVFSPARQNDDTDLTPDEDDRARNEFETGATPGEVGNELLILNWTDTNQDGTVDRVRVQMFRLIGLGEQPEAWVLDTFTRGLAFDGISVDQTQEGTRVTFRDTRLAPDAGTNSAEGELFLNGSLLLDLGTQ